MEGLHQILEAFNTGIIAAVGIVDANIDQFTKDFSPITAELAAIQHQKIVLDIILIVVGVAAVALFEAFVSRRRPCEHCVSMELTPGCPDPRPALHHRRGYRVDRLRHNQNRILRQREPDYPLSPFPNRPLTHPSLAPPSAWSKTS